MASRDAPPGKLVVEVTALRQQAEQLLHDRAAVRQLLDDAWHVAQMDSGLAKALAPLQSMVRAHMAGTYIEADDEDVAWALAAVMYVASPWDLTPDYLPGGLYDDERVAEWVGEEISSAVTAFEDWERAETKRLKLVQLTAARQAAAGPAPPAAS